MDGVNAQRGDKVLVLYLALYVLYLAKPVWHQRLNRLKDYSVHVLRRVLEMGNKSAVAFEMINSRCKFCNPKLGPVDRSPLSSGVTGFYFTLTFYARKSSPEQTLS